MVVCSVVQYPWSAFRSSGRTRRKDELIVYTHCDPWVLPPDMNIPLRWCQERHLTHRASKPLGRMLALDVTSGHWPIGKHIPAGDTVVVPIDTRNTSAVPGLCYLPAVSLILEIEEVGWYLHEIWVMIWDWPGVCA